jgi:hypothetical protein
MPSYGCPTLDKYRRLTPADKPVDPLEEGGYDPFASQVVRG